MKLGRITGTVVSTRKDERLEGLRMYIVRDLSIRADGAGLVEKDAFVVAVDSVGAGVGEVVLYASGSSARQTVATDKRPVDAVIMAIVDAVDAGTQVIYDKAAAEAS
jgi:ethanolamine utilization protein EutN